MQLCDYGCGQEAKYQFKNGKWCCSKNTSLCPKMRKINSEKNIGRIVSIKTRNKLSISKIGKKFTTSHKENLSKAHKGKILSNEHKRKISESNKGRIFSNKHRNKLRIIRLGVKGYFKGKRLSKEHKKKISKSNKGRVVSNECKDKIRNTLKFSIKDYKKNHPFLFKVEELKENIITKEIQVHCKNHECENSKEKGGWFTPTSIQLYERIRCLDNNNSYFYCSQKCKDECPLYGVKNDPYRNINKPYTSEEYQTFRTFVLERDNYICQFCGKPATDVHHERPQKLEPFFSLDPDYAWSCCKKCHYEKGHKDECSTGNLAKIVCRN